MTFGGIGDANHLHCIMLEIVSAAFKDLEDGEPGSQCEGRQRWTRRPPLLPPSAS